MIWYEHRANNIPTNPISCWFAIDFSSKYSKTYRYFYIIPQYPSEDGFTTKDGDDPELYVLFEGRCTEYERGDARDSLFNDMLMLPEKTNGEIQVFWDSSKSTFLRAFKTIEEAKARAQVNIDHMNAIKETYFGTDDEND